MIKKILLTALVIFLAYLFIRWKQKKSVLVAQEAPAPTPQRVGVYYLAGGLVTVMLGGILYWLFIQ